MRQDCISDSAIIIRDGPQLPGTKWISFLINYVEACVILPFSTLFSCSVRAKPHDSAVYLSNQVS